MSRVACRVHLIRSLIVGIVNLQTLTFYCSTATEDEIDSCKV